MGCQRARRCASPPSLQQLSSGDARPEPAVTLPQMQIGEQVTDDYLSIKPSLKAHPMALLRSRFDTEGLLPASHWQILLWVASLTSQASCLSVVPAVQKVYFHYDEDETGVANLPIWPDRLEKFRQ